MKLLNQLRPAGILVVMIAALAGSFLTYNTLKNNVVQYSRLPKTLTVQVPQSKDSVLSFEVVSKLPALVKSTNASATIKTSHLLFHQNPVFLVWIVLISLMIAIAAASCVVFTGRIVQVTINLAFNRIWLVTSVLLAAGMIFVLSRNEGLLNGYYTPPQIIHDFKILLKKSSIVEGVVDVTLWLLTPVIALMFLIAFISDRIIGPLTTKKEIETGAQRLNMLNETLYSALQTLAIVVVFSVLTSSALRLSILSVFEVKGYDIFPKQASYVYGIYFSFFLGVLYIPIYQYLKYHQGKIKEAIATLHDHEEKPDIAWAQTTLSTIKFESTALNNIKLALTVLSPLITSFLPGTLDLVKF